MAEMIKFVYLALVCCELLFAVNAVSNCIENGGQKKCSKLTSSTDCNTEVTGLSCMDFYKGDSGKIKSYCAGPQQQGCWCDPSLTSAEACAQGLSCQAASCSKNGCQYACLSSDSIGIPVCSAAQAQWIFVYENDGNGNPLSGTNILDLYNGVVQGAEVKVWTAPFGLVDIQETTAHVDNVGNMFVYGQSLFYTAPLDNITANPRSMMSVFSTNGNQHLTAFYVGKPTNVLYLNSNIPVQMKWYMRKTNQAVGNMAALSRAVQDGGRVRVGLRGGYRYLDSVEVDASKSRVSGIAELQMRPDLYGIQFNTTEQWTFTHVNSAGHVEQSSWLVNNHTRTEYVEYTNQTIDWFVDPCWNTVYRHSGDGSALFGSLSALRTAINQGKQIRILVLGKFYQANVITVNPDGGVEIQVYDSMNSDLANIRWNILLLSTNGIVRRIETDVGDGEYVTETTVTSEMVYFAEGRNYCVAANVDVNGTVVNGSKQNIIDAYTAGKEIRCSRTSDEHTVWYSKPDIVFRVGPDIRIFNNRELSIDNMYLHRFSFLFTSGTYQTAEYKLETDQLQPRQVHPRAQTTWVISC